MAPWRIGQKGLTLIQLVITMGMLSVGLLIALQVTKFQHQASSIMKDKSSRLENTSFGIKRIKSLLSTSSLIDVKGVSTLEYTVSSFETGTYLESTYKLSLQAVCNNLPCLTLKQNGKIIQTFPTIKDIKFCHIVTASLCTEFTDLVPGDLLTNSKRLLIKIIFNNKKSTHEFIVINIKNTLDDRSVRDDYYFI